MSGKWGTIDSITRPQSAGAEAGIRSDPAASGPHKQAAGGLETLNIDTPKGVFCSRHTAHLSSLSWPVVGAGPPSVGRGRLKETSWLLLNLNSCLLGSVRALPVFQHWSRQIVACESSPDCHLFLITHERMSQTPVNGGERFLKN